MKRKLALAFILCCYLCVDCFSQTVFIHGKATKRKLTWADFKGKPDSSSSFWAHTGYLVKYRYDNVTITGETANIGNFEVSVELDPARTWAKMDKISDELLTHEQGHFDIGILCAREMLRTFRETRFDRSNYENQISSIFQDIIRKYNEMGRRYDAETEHFKNKEQQQKWNALLAEKLEKY